MSRLIWFKCGFEKVKQDLKKCKLKGFFWERVAKRKDEIEFAQKSNQNRKLD